MKLLSLIVLCLCLGLILGAHAQTPILPFTATGLPTLIGTGASYNQLGAPRESFWLTGITPFSNAAGMYAIATSDLLPIMQLDSATGRKVYTLQGSLRAGVCKTLRPWTGKDAPADMLLVCGDAGFGLSQASASGAALNVNLSSEFGLPFVHQFNAHWAILAELRGVWVPTIGAKGAWNFIPEIGILFRP